jgi:hypothetical protein
MVTSWPVLAFQYLLKAALNSTYNSRVGSYETFNKLTLWAEARVDKPALARTNALRRRLMNRRFVFIKTSEMHLKNKMSEF